ncbi:zinc uptake protein ZrgA [Vibrio sp.]|uniref:zinc uptake protein ZrgA n=1 Tax=Vibrio sp. TaxID=678 RepID=UPI003D0F4009
MFTKPLLVLSLSAALSGGVFAQDFRQHDAHVHGHVELNIAQDGHDLLIEVTAPGANVVGFEHPPETDQERQSLNRALEILEQANGLFNLTTQANCQLEEAHITHSLDGEKHHTDQHHHEHEHHHDHDHDHDHDHQHGEFNAQYHYHCENISDLRHIDSQWFKLFPSTEKMSVNLLTDKVQTALALTPKQTRISL